MNFFFPMPGSVSLPRHHPLVVSCGDGNSTVSSKGRKEEVGVWCQGKMGRTSEWVPNDRAGYL